jgi:hypothetical protein
MAHKYSLLILYACRGLLFVFYIAESNEFTGPIPSELGKLITLEELNLST